MKKTVKVKGNKALICFMKGLISKESVKLINCGLFHITWNTYPHILIKSRSQLREASGRQNNIKARLVSSPLLLASLQKVMETKKFTVIRMWRRRH